MATFGVTEALSAAGLAISAASAVGTGISQAHAASYQAAVARNNAAEAAQNATYAREAGTVQTELAGRRAAANLAAVRTGIAANNVDVNSGSALDVQKGERETGVLSEETTANNALLQAYGYNTNATSFSSQAGLLSSQAATAVPGSLLSATGTLATNVGLAPKFAGLFTGTQPVPAPLPAAQNPEAGGAVSQIS